MLPCEGPGRDIMSVRVRHIPMARGGGGPTKSITCFDRLDCGPSSSSFADAAGGGGATRNLIFIPTCVSACEGDAEDAKDAELKASCLFLALLHEGGRGNRPATRGRLRARAVGP